MGKKSGPKAPPAPDPVATANAQAAANKEAAITQANLNRIDQYTPQGSLTYQQVGKFADGTPRYSQTQSYSPEQQALYDQENQIAQALNGLAGQNISRVQQAQSTPFSYDGMAPMRTSVANSVPGLIFGNGVNPVRTGVGPTGPVRGDFNPGFQLQQLAGTPGAIGGKINEAMQRNEGGITRVDPNTGGSIGRMGAGAGGAVTDLDANAGGAVGRIGAGAGGDVGRFDPSNAGSVQNFDASRTGRVQNMGPNAGGAVQRSLDYSNLTNLPGVGDFGAEAQRVSNSVYDQARSRLDPQFSQTEGDIRARLANSGISENSEAFRREMDNFGRTRNDAYSQANFNAIQAGGAEQSRLFGLSMGARQQGAAEQQSAGQFANAAQQQQYGQIANNQQLNNAAQQQRYAQGLGQATFNNAAQQQRFGQEADALNINNAAQAQQYGQIANSLNLNNAAQAQQFGQAATANAANNAAQQQRYGQTANNLQLNNAAAGQQFQQAANAAGINNQAEAQAYSQNMGTINQQNAAQQQRYGQIANAFELNNAAQGQQFNQNMQRATFGNQAQDQQFQQQLSQADLYNQAMQQQYQQGQQSTATYNTAQNQAFNQQLTDANLQNAARQQQIQEATYLRNLPLNEIAALMGTGGSVQNPMFNDVSQVGVAAPDYQGAVYNNYNAAMQQYQTKMANRSAGLGSIFGMAGSLGAAAISDRRLKHNAYRVGELANGIATYVFSYIGDSVRRFGVMAQDVLKVRPDAVITMPNGYMAVDYGKVW